MEPQASSERSEGPGADAFLASEPDGASEQGSRPAPQARDQGGVPGDEISQAERAAMHPDQHDLEWRYYCHAWSH
jgi:hypothetical protein